MKKLENFDPSLLHSLISAESTGHHLRRSSPKFSGFRFLDLDDFRRLTGHGKEFAVEVEIALMGIDVESGGALSEYIDCLNSGNGGVVRLQAGALMVHFAPGYAPPYGPQYVSFETEFFDAARAEELTKYGTRAHEVMLALCLWRDGRKMLVNLPLKYVLGLKHYKRCIYQVYQHAFNTDSAGQLISGYHYVGVTKRGWQERWREHVRAANAGSRYLFHAAIRELLHSSNITHTVHGIMETEAEAMALEEKLVALESKSPLGLNMIDGGYAGVRALHRFGAVRDGERVSADNKEDIINRFYNEATSRRGVPNPGASANWLDPGYAEAVVCGGPDRLKPPQIREARYLETLGLTAEQIAAEIAARNVSQVQRLLDGVTYSRVT